MLRLFARAHAHRSSLWAEMSGSISGNCRTVMVANITSAPEQLEESISTCRFAQRVAMVSCEVRPATGLSALPHMSGQRMNRALHACPGDGE